MFRVFLVALFTLALFWVSPFLAQQNGSVTFVWGEYTYRVTLFTFVLGAICGLAALYIVEALVRLVLRLLFGWWTGRKDRRAAKSMQQVQQGVRQLIAGDYVRAQKYLDKSVKNAPDKCLNLLQTFEAALRNKDMVTAEYSLKQAIEVATEKDRDLLDVCKLKFYVAKGRWRKATRALHDVLHRVNTEEVNLLALKIYKATTAYGRFEDLLPVLLKRKWIDQEQHDQELRWLENGLQEQHYPAKDNPKELLDWFYTQPNYRRYGCIARNVLLEKLLKAEQWAEAVQVACDSLELVPLKELEKSEFFDLLLQIKTDSIDKKLTRRLERKFHKFSKDTQLKVMHVLSDLYFLQGNYLKAQHWIEQQIQAEKDAGLHHSPQTLLLAQVVYRRLGYDNKLQELASSVDKQYLIGGPAAAALAAEEAAQAAEKAEGETKATDAEKANTEKAEGKDKA